jgi:glycosyltransferase involved in cell wall biosynthesis
MMTGENIVCFAKDWNEDPTSNNHIMKLIARTNEVLWINSIATRTPNFTSGRDLSKIVTKLKGFTKGPIDVGHGLHVYTPIVLPFPHNRFATAANSMILNESIKILRAVYDMSNDFQLWSFIPTAGQYVGKMGESLVVYYCTDEWSNFSYVDKDRISSMERDLCHRADIVFTTSRTLLESKKQYNPNTYLASHGVDHEHFSKALSEGTKVADEIAKLKGSTIGFVGLVQDWIDTDLIAYMAQKKPGWNFVIIGKVLVDVSNLKNLPNVYFLGRKPYEELPTYMKAFDVGIIPFKLNELTRNVNPIKLREYFSAGLPVVSTNIPEVNHYADFKFGDGNNALGCGVAYTYEGFLSLCEAAIVEDSQAARKHRSNLMLNETWERKVSDIGNHIRRAKNNKLRLNVAA